MSTHRVVVMGLPGSGKTTFLAAFWHLVVADDIPTRMKLGQLTAGSMEHLHAIARRWREAREQYHTPLGSSQIVRMSLLDSSGSAANIVFPDLPGETYRRMWEERACEPAIAEILKEGNVLFFLHADDIRGHLFVVDANATTTALNLPVSQETPVTWSPDIALTQVKIVDLLQLMRRPPLNAGPRKLALVLSAWDKVEPEGLTPDQYLRDKFPLLAQYLFAGEQGWDWRVYGLSAQGGEYETDADDLRDFDKASTRILLTAGEHTSNDITEPIEWLMADERAAS